MKKFLIIVFCFWIISSVYVGAYSSTGHDSITAIDFVDEGKLLIDMTSTDIKNGYEDMGKRKFWGWKHHHFTIKKEATYVGEIIFAKSNRSSQAMEIDYNLTEKVYDERSVKLTGSLSGKFKGQIKKIDTTVDAGVSGELEDTSSITRIEETSFTLVVEPNSRLVFRITGDALISNGVSKYYVFGITFNKGSWEYLDITTRYYELIEEEIVE